MRSADLDPELPYLAAMSVIPSDSANAIFDRWVREGNPSAHIALDWWAGRGDTSAIRRFVNRARARTRSNDGYERHYSAARSLSRELARRVATLRTGATARGGSAATSG